jgi:ribokinase
VGVVGHVEWVTHARGRVPGPGQIVDLADPLVEPAGGGGVAAAAAARQGAEVVLMTALGADAAGWASARRLRERGIEVVAAARAGSQTPVLVIADARGERTIMVVGPRLQPRGEEDLPWGRLAAMDAVYYAGEDPAALRLARAAPRLVVTGRRLDDLAASGVRADVVVASGADPDEDPARLALPSPPDAVVVTEGARGGRIRDARGERRYAPAGLAGPVADAYGCGDAFAAGLTLGLARGLGIDDAVVLGAHLGAAQATWRGGLGP